MVGLSFWMLERTRDSTAVVIATREMRSALADLFSLVQDTEIGQRGYLLTGEERYLQPYEKAVANVDDGIKRVERLLRNRPDSTDFLARVRPLIAAKLAELKETVDLKTAGKNSEALEAVLTDRG